ncbi:MAG: hypothetical protein IJX94_00600 [Clostridia bacterium]|nr:hypothetical protein [Clostridia bacterium]
MNETEMTLSTELLPEETLPSASEEESQEELPIAEETKAEINSEEEITRLRDEIAQLRSALSQQEQEKEHVLRELKEFNRLFPETSVKQIPNSVWKQVEGGLPLSAAYALYERETLLSTVRADEINRRNAALSSGKAGKNTPAEYFSPDEVRAMSQKQVHENYAIIVESMKRWH